MFAAPLGLLGLLAVPAIVALHLFRRRFRPRTVSALHLWVDADRTPLAGRKRERLRRSWSLWAEIAAAVALVLALSGLRGCGDEPGEHLVVVLDASASMGAVHDGRSVARRVVDELSERIDDLPRGSRVTIVASGAHPTLIAGPAAFPEEARATLASFAPLAQRHDLASSVAFASQLSGGARVVVYTDRYEPDRFPADVELVSLGTPLDNVGFVRATRERSTSGEERALYSVENFGEHSAERTIELALVDGGRAIGAPTTVVLAPRERKELAQALPAGTGPIVARLAKDALEVDDEAWLAPPPARTIAVASTLDEASSRALGLMSAGSKSKLDRLLAIVGESVEAPSLDSAHLVIADAVAGGPSTWCLAIERGAGEHKAYVGPFLFEKRHPLLEGVTLEGVVWSADPTHALAGFPLVAAGNVPLAVEDEQGGKRVFRFDLDPAQSSLARSPDWPILLVNLCELRRRSLPGPERTNVAVGDELAYRAGSIASLDAGPFTFEAEDGSTPRHSWAPRPEILVDAIERPGMHRLRQGSTTLCRVAATFADPFESDLSSASSGRRAATAAAPALEATASWVEALLLSLAVAAILADWIVLRRSERSASSIAPTKRGEGGPRGLPAP